MGDELLEVPDFAFFAVFVQRSVWHLGNVDALDEFMDDVANKVSWVKTKAKGTALARRLSQSSPDGPLSALLEVFTASRIETSGRASLMEIEPRLENGRNLDARFRLPDGQEFLSECFASLSAKRVVEDTQPRFWSPDNDPDIPKIHGKILDKAEQAEATTLPVVMVMAPGPDFLFPSDKIPVAVRGALQNPRSATISAVAIAGGTHPFLCEAIAALFVNSEPRVPITPEIEQVLRAL
jgi:hypothetical protein